VSAAACRSADLALSLGASQGAAGSTYQSVVFVNTGAQACTMFGYPGAAFVDAGGKVLGKPASRDPGKKHTVTLSPGGSAYTVVREPDADNFPPSACRETTADRLQVYPPGETVQLFVSDHATVCTTNKGRAGILPVRAGTGG
jgi:hypothetical protein